MELRGWIYHATKKIQRIDFIIDSKAPQTQINLPRPEISKKLNLSHCEIGMYHLSELTSTQILKTFKSLVYLEGNDKPIEIERDIPQNTRVNVKRDISIYNNHIYTVEDRINTFAKEVDIFIPFRDESAILKNCVRSIACRNLSLVRRVVLINNNSKEKTTARVLKELTDSFSFLEVLDYNAEFNFSAILNFARLKSNSRFLLFMNNDIEVLTSNWIEALGKTLNDNKVGIVGPKLLYPDMSIQHSGIIFQDLLPRYIWKHYPRTIIPGNKGECLKFNAITGACFMIKRDIFDSVNGMDENLVVTLNDIDLCLKIRKRGLHCIVNQEVEMIHHESVTRDQLDNLKSAKRSIEEQNYFIKKWQGFNFNL